MPLLPWEAPASTRAPAPAWHTWTGVNGLLYASTTRCSPPIVVRSDTPAGLARAIAEREGRL